MKAIITEADRRELAAKYWPSVRFKYRRYPVWYQKTKVESLVRADIARLKSEVEKPRIDIVQEMPK